MIEVLEKNFVPKLINQLYEIEKKANRIPEAKTLLRNVGKIKELLSESGFEYEDPTNQIYNDTRTDCEAQVLAGGDGTLKIIETIKPIIRISRNGYKTIYQKAIVIVQAEDKKGGEE
jgi:hypothetical protein